MAATYNRVTPMPSLPKRPDGNHWPMLAAITPAAPRQPPRISAARFSDACRPPRLRFVVAIATAVWVLVGTAGCGLVHTVPSAFDPPHPILTSLHNEFAVTIDHAVLDRSSSHACPKTFAVVLPMPASVLVALGIVALGAAVAGWFAHPVLAAGRGPPRGLAGRDLLTRLCLARR